MTRLFRSSKRIDVILQIADAYTGRKGENSPYGSRSLNLGGNTWVHLLAFTGLTKVLRRCIQGSAVSSAESGDMELLIVRPSDLELVNRSGWTALHWAAHKGDVETLRLLLDEGTHVCRPAANQFTPLALAASFGYLDAVRCLISAEEEATKTMHANCETSRLKPSCSPRRLY
jgi:ankyrin repeat protein